MNFIPLYPEIFLLVATCVILLTDMFLSDSKRYLTSVLSLVALGVTAALTLSTGNSGGSEYTSSNMFVSDPLSMVLKLASYAAVGMTLIYSRAYATARGMSNGSLGGEFYVLSL